MSETAIIDGVEFDLPARPAVLAELSAELESYDPDFRKVSNLVNKDLGLAAAVVRAANSPLFGVSGRIVSVQQAVNFLGLAQVFALITGVMLRRVFPEDDSLIDELWDMSTKRAAIMAQLAHNTLMPADRAYTVGLFQDCGVALLAMRSPHYRGTWARARWAVDAPRIEQREHAADHSRLSATLARHWGFASEIALALAQHHDIDSLDSPEPSRVRGFVALSVFANFALAGTSSRDDASWAASLEKAAATFELSPLTAQAWLEQAKLHLDACAAAL